MRIRVMRDPRLLAWIAAQVFVFGIVAPRSAAPDDGAAARADLARTLADTQRQVRALERELAAQQQLLRRRLDELQAQVRAQAAEIERLRGHADERAAVGAAASSGPPTAAAGVGGAAGTPPVAAAGGTVSAPAAAAAGGAAVAPASGGAAVAPSAPTWSPEQPLRVLGGAQAYLNLSFDALVDAGWSTTSDVRRLQLGDHDPNQRGFTIPNTEIVVDGAVDPYFKGAADVVFKLDENNETEVELEEAYLLSTSLPWNLQVKGGQFLTEFGRQNQQHPHAWDFVDLPLVLARILGPEGLRNPGARVSWLAPTPFYSEAFLTVMDSQGSTAASFRDTGEVRFGRTPIDTRVQNPGDLLYVPRYAASFDVTSSQTLVTGISGAFGPNATGKNTDTRIYGADLYWKWKPEWQSAGWPFLSFQAEGLYRRFEAASGIEAGSEAGANGPILLPRESLHDYGFYAQALYGFTRRWVAGLRGEYVAGDHGAFHPDPDRADRFRLSPNLTFYPSEFSKIRLQWNYDHGQLQGDDHSVWLQTEFLLGAHAAHKF